MTQGRATLGTIVIALNQEKAPISVENFLQYVRAGHYDGTVFHRVMPNFMIQGGGYTPELVEKPTRPPIKNEARNGLRNSRGTVAMARTNDPNSATSQFFINVRDNHRLDFGIERRRLRRLRRGRRGAGDRGHDLAHADHDPQRAANAPETSVVIRKARELKTWTPPPPPAPKPAADAPPKP